MILPQHTLSNDLNDLFPGQWWRLDGRSPPAPAADPLAQAMVNPTSALRHALTRFVHPRTTEWEHYTPWSGIPGEWGNPDIPARPLLPLPTADACSARLRHTRPLHWSRTFGWRLAALISYVQAATFAGPQQTPWDLRCHGVDDIYGSRTHDAVRLQIVGVVQGRYLQGTFRCRLNDGACVLTIPIWWLYANPDDVQRVAVESRRRRLLAEGVVPAPAPESVNAELDKRMNDAWMALGLREYNARLRAGWLAASEDVDAWLTRVRGHLLERDYSVFEDALMDVAEKVNLP